MDVFERISALENRRRELQRRIPELRERERVLSKAIARALIEGGDSQVHRPERRNVREDLEDTFAALAWIDEQLAQLRAGAPH